MHWILNKYVNENAACYIHVKNYMLNNGTCKYNQR